MKKGKFERSIDIIFLVILVMKIFFSCIEWLPLVLDETEIMLNMRSGNEFAIRVFLATALFAVSNSIYVIGIYIGFKIAIRKFNRERITKIDLKNDTYYRDIIKKLSPAVLSYIDDFEIDKKDIVATVISLEMKNKIKIADTIEILDYNDDGLTQNEQYILNSIKNKSMKAFNMQMYKNVIIEECIENELLSIKKGLFRNKKMIPFIIVIAVRNFSI